MAWDTMVDYLVKPEAKLAGIVEVLMKKYVVGVRKVKERTE